VQAWSGLLMSFETLNLKKIAGQIFFNDFRTALRYFGKVVFSGMVWSGILWESVRLATYLFLMARQMVI
jgi:hypothetical protein